MDSLFLRVLAAALVCFMAGTHPVLALAGTLDRPSLAFPSSMDPAWRESVMKVLNDRPADFAGGRFINALTTLRYQGSAESLNAFLAGLAGCTQLRIQIRFASNLDCSWELEHNGWADPRDLQVTIHLGPEGIPPEALQLPVIRGGAPSTPTSQPPVEQPF